MKNNTLILWLHFLNFRLDGKHVVFGKVLNKASKDIVKRIDGFGSKTGNPKAKLTIDRCTCE